ncbi:hypothetical protein PM082_013628 [Marasmius tenuissimus]|nr:hypothetical protein PM082_013628 [Marasmius tenuissimus]
MSGIAFVMLFFSGCAQILIYGVNTVLYSIGMYLLRRRRTRDGTLFQAISSTIVFVFATMSVVVGTVAVVADYTSSSAPFEIDARACSIIQFVVLHLVDAVASMILVYRCFNIWSRSWKIIVVPILTILSQIGAYYFGLHQYVQINYATDLQDRERPEVLAKSLVLTTATLLLGAFAHALLTVLIAGRIWWVKTQLRQLVAPENRVASFSSRKYDSVIALTVESGVIIPIFQVIYIVFNVVNTDSAHDALTVMAYMFPQVIAFVPLLIMVRVGLGLTVERNHVSGLTNPSFLRGASGPPHFLNVQSQEVVTPVVAGPADEINLNFESREFTDRFEPTKKSRSEEVCDAGSHIVGPTAAVLHWSPRDWGLVEAAGIANGQLRK